MFERLFAESGLSLDRLRTLLEVGAAGSIVKAADADAVRQSQYSRQIKELEDFFKTKLIERQGRGMRLTSTGRELARISRFFLMGLSNFQRGNLAGEQTFRIGASATFISVLLLPVLARPEFRRGRTKYAVEVVGDEEIERRLHDLTLDFGIVTRADLSRPLRANTIGAWKLELWVSRALRLTRTNAVRAFRRHNLPLVVPVKEIAALELGGLAGNEPAFECESFLEAQAVLANQPIAAFLPSFFLPVYEAEIRKQGGIRVPVPELDQRVFEFHLGWNPRLVRLNPHAARWRDLLHAELTRQMGA